MMKGVLKQFAMLLSRSTNSVMGSSEPAIWVIEKNVEEEEEEVKEDEEVGGMGHRLVKDIFRFQGEGCLICKKEVLYKGEGERERNGVLWWRA